MGDQSSDRFHPLIKSRRLSESLFGWIGPKTLVQPHEWTAFLLRRVGGHIYHLTTANLLKSRTPIITGVTPIIACLTSETQQNRLSELVKSHHPERGVS